MMLTHPRLCSIALLVTSLGLSASAFAEGDKNVYTQAKLTARADKDAALKACDPLAGNAKDICKAEAKLNYVKAEETAEANYKGTAKAHKHAVEEIAEAEYDLAKERCDDKAGNDKDVCVKEAKAARDQKKADAKANKNIAEEKHDADETKRKAQYKAEVEKCDKFSGDTKDSCVDKTKKAYGM